MDKKEFLERPMGIPLDPAKQKDPEEHGDRVPAEGRAEHLNDVTEQNGGQRSEVGVPWNSSSLEKGLSEEYDKHGGRGERGAPGARGEPNEE
ncbi:hypothetical protein F0U60_42990 [Archangium minus]|uniref:Uncharacterized protein n=1 Tax=Archangium minus TaxID=83450 RepID=A0ABY9X406_9BACT|nr:hypothetical protein F0U60_42990 [Archangium minus]